MILYFTGTGNSRWIAEQLAEATQDTAVGMADCLRRHAMPEGLSEAERVGVVFPVHSWYAPRVVVDFLMRIRLPRCRYRYAVCTCGDDAGKCMTRLAAHFPLDAAWSATMPNTYIPMFELDSDRLCRQKVEEARRLVAFMAGEVLQQKRVWKVHEGSAAWLKTYLINPLSVRFIIRSSGFRVESGCVSCGTCGASCPVGNIRMEAGRPVWGEHCIHCMACVHACPRKVIQYGRNTWKKGRYRLSDYLGKR